MRKTSLLFSRIIYHILVLLSISLLLSCKKEDDLVIPPTTSAFTLRDTLTIQLHYQTGAFSDEYNRYNGKFYNVNSRNKTEISVQKTGNSIAFWFVDSSVTNLYPSFLITLNKTGFENLALQYNLADSTTVTVKTNQTFVDGASAISLRSKVISGILKMKYNNRQNTLSGEISNLKVPLEYFTQEDISIIKRSSNGILIKNGGSTRTVSLNFDDVKIK